MTRTVLSALKTAPALVLAAMLAAAAPAYAGGSIGITVAPANPDEARAMRAGLVVYSLVNGFNGGSGIRQNGVANAAGLAQNGSGNLGVVHQQGSGHTGTLSQTGNGNAHGLFQFGNNSTGHVAQTGNGGTGATFVFGW